MSKRIWQHPELPADQSGVASWRSMGELEQSPAFQEHLDREFPEGSGFLSEEERETSRRSFMKLMGASSALGGLTLVSCRRPEAYIVPYKKAPEWVIPGTPLFYASTRPWADGAVPLVVTSFQGRPTKLETNREHPDSSGSDALTQASVLDLYAPNRSRDFLNKGQKSTREEFAMALTEIAKAPGKIAFVCGEDDCPTRNRLKGELTAAFPGSKFYSYEALRGLGKRAANEDVFGGGAEVLVDFEKADRILALDCDFLGTDPQGNSVAFSKRRQGGSSDYRHELDDAKMNRLYMVETAYSLTGGMADHRMRVAPSRVLWVAIQIARRVQAGTGDAELQGLLQGVGRLSLEEKKELFSGDANAFDDWVKACGDDLVEAAKKNKGAVVLAGSRQNEGLQRLVIAINKALQAYGSTVHPVKTGREGYHDIEQLVADLDAGTVDTVMLLTPSNPVYDTPVDMEFATHLAKAKVSIHLGLRTDATAKACTWHVPAAHYLESWSDARSASGVYSLVQPMILPLYDGVSELELLWQLLEWKDIDLPVDEAGQPTVPVLVSGEGIGEAPSPAYDQVRKTFAEIGGEGDDAWKEALRTGFVADTKYEPAEIGKDEKAATQIEDSLVSATPQSLADSQNLEVNFVADASVWDGRYIDNGWLQEAPDPISKLCWDNAAYVSPRTAKRLGVYEQMVELMPVNDTLIGKVANAPKPAIDEGKNAKAPMAIITVPDPRNPGKTLELKAAVLVAFGHADDCITISVGYGQGATDGREGVLHIDEDEHFPVVGLVARNTGFNANLIRGKAGGGFLTTGAKVEPATEEYKVAMTQEHHAMYGRALAREISTAPVGGKSFEQQVAGVRSQGPVDSHAPENISLYKRKGSTWEDDQDKREDLISDRVHQWGMAIDLNTCIGCNSCMVACQAENNIPIVGKDEVAMGREMHWIRMDRYFATPTYERDDHGHIEKEDGQKLKVPNWVEDNPELVPQPVACLHCENAPCETVCPVNATVHTEEGLNAMSYNRCIGTRYCANNCPYKARRFNYFDYNKRNPLIEHNLYQGPLGQKKVGEAAHLQRNPNVSVRMRGVMEKCTYCVQRLQSAKIKRKQILRAKTLQTGGPSTAVEISDKELRVETDSVRSACQEACPTEAISFGNLLDKHSQVWRAKYRDVQKEDGNYLPNPRNYDVLQYIGTVPRTSYLARVKNPNPAMPDAQYRGLATIHTG